MIVSDGVSARVSLSGGDSDAVIPPLDKVDLSERLFVICTERDKACVSDGDEEAFADTVDSCDGDEEAFADTVDSCENALSVPEGE